MRKEKNNQNTKYVVPLISATRSFTEAYTTLNLDYLNLLHETQTEAIRFGLQRTDLKVDPQKIKQKISEQMTEELVGKISLMKWDAIQSQVRSLMEIWSILLMLYQLKKPHRV